MTVHVCDAECRRLQADSRRYNSVSNARPLLAELEASGLGDDPLAVKLRALRDHDTSDRRWAEGERHSEARAGRDAKTAQDVARVRVARRHREQLDGLSWKDATSFDGRVLGQRINPRYAAYAAVHGHTADEQLAADTELFPGGKMVGFQLWIQERWRIWREANGVGRNEVLGEDAHRAFDQWLAQLVAER